MRRAHSGHRFFKHGHALAWVENHFDQPDPSTPFGMRAHKTRPQKTLCAYMYPWVAATSFALLVLSFFRVGRWQMAASSPSETFAAPRLGKAELRCASFHCLRSGTIRTFDSRRRMVGTAPLPLIAPHYTYRIAAKKAAFRAPRSEIRCRNDCNAGWPQRVDATL